MKSWWTFDPAEQALELGILCKKIRLLGLLKILLPHEDPGGHPDFPALIEIGV